MSTAESERASTAEAPAWSEQRVWAAIAHASSVLGWIVPGAQGFVNFVFSLAIWRARERHRDWVAENAKEALNFQLTMLLAWLGVYLLLPWGFFFWLVGVVNAYFSIKAGVRAMEGEAYRYPLNLRVLR